PLAGDLANLAARDAPGMLSHRHEVEAPAHDIDAAAEKLELGPALDIHAGEEAHGLEAVVAAEKVERMEQQRRLDTHHSARIHRRREIGERKAFRVLAEIQHVAEMNRQTG